MPRSTRLSPLDRRRRRPPHLLCLLALVLCITTGGACATDGEDVGDVEPGPTPPDGPTDPTGEQPPTGDNPPDEPDLDPEAPPSVNFDLSRWNISLPTDQNGDGKADTVSERDLVGYEAPSFFFTADDGGMVFRCPVKGVRTSENTKYVRVELREMLRGGNVAIPTRGVTENNWVLSTASAEDQAAAGGVDGVLEASLKVDHVTTSGDRSQVGRVIIGQIHARDDEPARLYYRKLPGHARGSVYLAHEPSGRDDLYVELIGSRSDSAPDPPDGIALGEEFSYEIRVRGDDLDVAVKRPGRPDVAANVDIGDSGYDSPGEFMYFKAGVYNQNNTGDDDDFVQATFYDLQHSHGEPAADR